MSAAKREKPSVEPKPAAADAYATETSSTLQRPGTPPPWARDQPLPTEKVQRWVFRIGLSLLDEPLPDRREYVGSRFR